jgi:hypothetical protein
MNAGILKSSCGNYNALSYICQKESKKTCLQETLQTGKRKEKQMIYDSLF